MAAVLVQTTQDQAAMAHQETYGRQRLEARQVQVAVAEKVAVGYRALIPRGTAAYMVAAEHPMGQMARDL